MLEVVRYYWDCFESGAIYKKSRPKDQVALSALSELLSGGKSSVLNKVLIDEKAMVNQFYLLPAYKHYMQIIRWTLSCLLYRE